MSQTSPDLKLRRLENYNEFNGPVVFLILDGVGIGKRDESDGVFRAYTPVLDELFKEPLYTQLRAHGRAVGLPTDEDMGNSEVGHNALGAGRVFSQGAMLVNDAIATGALYKGKTWQQAIERGKRGHTVHFIGLLSDGNVHSHIDHLFAMLREAAKEGVKRVRVHALIDGRDVGERSAPQYVKPTEDLLAELSTDGRDYRIASGGGRMITTMDRYGADWTVVERGWKAHVLGIGDVEVASASEAIDTFYKDASLVDQYLPSFVIVEDGKPVGTIEDDDAVIFFNFRGDRAIEISQAFEAANFDKFDRKRVPNVFYAGLMQYDGDAQIPTNFLVEPPAIDRTIGQYICANGVPSYAVSETQKYGHVTYFWNGNNSGYICENLEKYEEIRSDVIPFDQRPWMKGAEITDAMIAAVESGKYKFLRLNYPNGDMVGHTGNVSAILIAVESVDLCLARLLPVIEKQKGIVVITADHGNADQMFTEKKGKREPMVAHTLNPVPFIIKDYSGANTITMRGVEAPGLSNIAATLLNLLGYEKPADYDESLIRIG